MDIFRVSLCNLHDVCDCEWKIDLKVRAKNENEASWTYASFLIKVYELYNECWACISFFDKGCRKCGTCQIFSVTQGNRVEFLGKCEEKRAEAQKLYTTIYNLTKEVIAIVLNQLKSFLSTSDT